MSDPIVVIVGGGQAGAQTAISLRQEGFVGRIVVIAGENLLPYARPPLCKAYLSDLLTPERLLIRPLDDYLARDIEFRLGVAASRLRIKDRSLDLADGDSLAFDHLVFATGGRARRLGTPGAEHPRVGYLRTLADADRIRERLRPGARLVLIGGGYIGLELASVARRLGLAVTVLERSPQLLVRVTSPVVADFYQHVHRQNGVDVRCNTAVRRIDDAAGGLRLVAESGEVFEADLAIAAIGMEPNVELALDAGIVCNRGIVVDEFGRSSVPGIYATGDCSEQASALYGTQIHLQSVPNAIGQGRTVAATICGKQRPHRQVPWFWSDQYDLKLQTAGLGVGHDRIVVRGKPEQRSFAAFYLRGDRLLAVDAINRPVEFSLSKTWIADRVPISVERIANDALSPLELVA